MNFSYIVFSLFFFGFAYWFLKYNNAPFLWTQEDTRKAEEEGMSEEMILALKLSRKIGNIKGTMAGVLAIILGLLLIRLSFIDTTSKDILWDFFFNQ